MASTEAIDRDAGSRLAIPCTASRIALPGSNPVDRVMANFFLASTNLPVLPLFQLQDRGHGLACPGRGQTLPALPALAQG
ncbi:hypothetical protein M1D88_09715 [Arthrobacter sp. R1-13]